MVVKEALHLRISKDLKKYKQEKNKIIVAKFKNQISL